MNTRGGEPLADKQMVAAGAGAGNKVTVTFLPPDCGDPAGRGM